MKPGTMLVVSSSLSLAYGFVPAIGVAQDAYDGWTEFERREGFDDEVGAPGQEGPNADRPLVDGGYLRFYEYHDQYDSLYDFEGYDDYGYDYYTIDYPLDAYDYRYDNVYGFDLSDVDHVADHPHDYRYGYDDDYERYDEDYAPYDSYFTNDWYYERRYP